MNILYLIATPNIYGGTPKKLLDMVKHSHNRCVIYFWSDAYNEKQVLFREAGAITYTGAYGRNIFSHLRIIANIIDKYSIDVIQTQFSFGEVLGYFVKLIRPKVKLVVAFVGPFNPPLVKRVIVNFIYRRVDAFIYISEYVKKEKLSAFPILAKRAGRVIYNGASPLPHTNQTRKLAGRYQILAVSFLVGWKNIVTMIRAMDILALTLKQPHVELLVIGDGPERKNLERLISDLQLNDNVKLLGYREDVGDFLHSSNLFAHPSLAEGFGIAVAEAMMAGLPIVAASAGALPELIINGESGLLVDPLDAQAWAGAIIKLMNDATFAKQLGDNGKFRAKNMFSVEKFVANYEKFYKEIINGK